MDNPDVQANKAVLRTATRNLQEALQLLGRASLPQEMRTLGDCIVRVNNAVQQTINVVNNLLDDE
jgi:hypothetical protein